MNEIYIVQCFDSCPGRPHPGPEREFALLPLDSLNPDDHYRSRDFFVPTLALRHSAAEIVSILTACLQKRL